jgi:hypothetical protein
LELCRQRVPLEPLCRPRELTGRAVPVIYRVLVDYRQHVQAVMPCWVVTRRSLRALAGLPDLCGRLAPIIGKVFPDRESFIGVLSQILGSQHAMSLWPQMAILAVDATADRKWMAISWSDARDRRFGGPGYGRLADVMQDRGLRRPRTSNPRLRYYFTDLGWQMVGRHVAAEARRIGHLVKVVREKNPLPSQVAYRDRYQVAILPRSRAEK